MLSVNVAKALASERRLQILGWLQTPRAHFPPQVDGDLVRDGVCGVFIAQKLGVSQPTASEHLKILAQAGLVRARRIRQWTFYKRDEKRIAEVKRAFRSAWWIAHRFVIADAFTQTAFGGNQLAVFPDARGLSARAMQSLAREFNFAETTFVLPPEDPRHTRRVRIF